MPGSLGNNNWVTPPHLESRCVHDNAERELCEAIVVEKRVTASPAAMSRVTALLDSNSPHAKSRFGASDRSAESVAELVWPPPRPPTFHQTKLFRETTSAAGVRRPLRTENHVIPDSARRTFRVAQSATQIRRAQQTWKSFPFLGFFTCIVKIPVVRVPFAAKSTWTSLERRIYSFSRKGPSDEQRACLSACKR